MKGKLTRSLRPMMILLGACMFLAGGGCLPRHFWADLAGSTIETATNDIIAGVIGLFFP